MQKLEHCKKSSLLVIGTEKGEGTQVKGKEHISNKIIDETFSNLRKGMPTNVQEAYRTQNRKEQKRNPPII